MQEPKVGERWYVRQKGTGKAVICLVMAVLSNEKLIVRAYGADWIEDRADALAPVSPSRWPSRFLVLMYLLVILGLVLSNPIVLEALSHGFYLYTKGL